MLKFLRFSSRNRRRNRNRNRNPTPVARVVKKSPVLKLLRSRSAEVVPAPLKTLKALARLETAKKLRKDLNNPKQVIKEHLTTHIPLRYTFKLLNFRTRNEICKARARRRDEIMARTRGAGLRVKKTTWRPESYLQCDK
nr:hypothetical protein DWCPWQHM_DWCPWQHM_CDS_0002 [Microvirus sp.]